MIDERFHQSHPAYEEIIALRAKHIHQATKIIAVSENTRNDLIELCGVHPEKIETIYHGNSFFTNLERRSLPALFQHKYILYTGKRYAYKNFERMLQSLIPLMKEDQSLQLVCAGGGAFKNTELNQLNRLHLMDRVIYQPIHSDEQLSSLYNHAALMVYPSLYEGFGLPIIEAFACGCPVVTSAGSSTGEIAGNAAVLINPNDTEDMTHKISKVLNDLTLQNQLVALGHNRAHLFNWDKTANQTLKLYQAI
jgi:glycosyltransferase involved in cell wall biosynthesis